MTMAPGIPRRLGVARRTVVAASDAVTSIWDSVRRAHARALHPIRHFAVCRRLSTAGRPRRILVVCNGNVCRSPYLQAVLKRSLPGIDIASAGFASAGRRVPPLALALGYQRGVDLAGHQSRIVSQSIISGSDIVIVMDAYQARRLSISFRLDSSKIVVAPDLAQRFEGARTIRDPWNGSAEAFESAFNHLDRCAATLVGLLRDAK